MADPGHTITVTREVDAPVEAVWQIVTDIPGSVDRLSSIESVEILSDDHTYRPGLRWKETRRVFGSQETLELWVEDVQAPSSTVIRADDDGAEYTTTFTLAPSKQGRRTRIVIVFGAHTPDAGLMAKLTWMMFGFVGGEFTKRMLRKDLDEIATAAGEQKKPAKSVKAEKKDNKQARRKLRGEVDAERDPVADKDKKAPKASTAKKTTARAKRKSTPTAGNKKTPGKP